MKKHLYKFLSCVLLIVAATSAYAENGIIETLNYKICPGDTITIDTRETVVYSDTILYDTIRVEEPNQDSIRRFIVNVYPPFLNLQERTLERGTSFEWRGLTIDKAGTYEKVYKTTLSDCDSIYRLIVRERVETQIKDTLCLGSSISFGGQTLTTGGIYRDTLHFNDYDSIVILSLLGVKPDTTITLRRIPEGTSTTFDGITYSEAGEYNTNHTNRFGCDSLSRLIVTTYHVDTIDTAVILCPSTTITWHGMTYGQSGQYEFPGTRENGDRVYYRINLTVKEIVNIDTTFQICDDENIVFHGKTYTNAGEYYDYYTCDTLYRITVVKTPGHDYVQYGTLDRTHPYYWHYGYYNEYTDTIWEPGRYAITGLNYGTGCNDHWILYLTRDESSYHFVETVTICENEPFSWRGRSDLNRSGIGQTTHYFDRYRTIADQDSVYELVLTVKPVLRHTQTLRFCESIILNGKTYDRTQVVVDTLTSVTYQCDSIVTTFLEKGEVFHVHDTATIVPGETIEWRGTIYDHDGLFEEKHMSAAGCDSIYSIGIGYKDAPPVTNTRSYYQTICEGDAYLWRNGKYYSNPGIYRDSLKNATGGVDSIFILHMTVHPAYALTERVSFLTFPQTYRGQIIDQPGAYEFRYHSMYGCDSIITAYIDQDIYTDEQTVTICPGETYIWNYDGETYTVGGKYTKIETNRQGQDSVRHILNLTVNYIPETSIEHTMCKGGQYSFGGETLTQSGVYRHTFHKEGGCDSVVVLSLNVLNPDTTYIAIQRNEGDTYVWENEVIYTPGIYRHYSTNRFGCDSVSILNFTYNQVDTVYGNFTVCPNELPFEWHGISANQTKRYTSVQQENDQYFYYVLDLTVREVAQLDTTFVICAGGSISFNGVTYDEAGHYRSYLSCDTLMNVHIVVNQPAIYVTYGTLTDDHGFTWQYIDHGTAGEQTYTTPGTYEFENPNPETGCNDIYRLILTKDETSYLFEDSQTICEGDDFSWHGLTNLSRVTGTNTYTDAYETRTGKDSIYILHLTVIPVERTVRTIVFCGETTWNGKTYDHSAVVYDTISLPTGCYRIERINLDKESSYHYQESKTLPQGTVLHWHGQNITTDGTYYDYGTTVNGCDSTYEITVTIIPAAPQSNQYAEELSTCEGDTIVWRGKPIWRSGVYIDTVFAAGTNQVDSVFTLTFTAWPAPKDTVYQHLYTCSDNSAIRYNGQDYYTDQTIVTTFHTIHGCDSIVKAYLHFNTALSLHRTDTIVDTQLPYRWTYQLYDEPRDTILTTSGTYTHIVASEGGCTNQEELTLVVLKTYLFEEDMTICETELPFLWRNQYLQHTIGETKQYEDPYKTVNNTDSIYRINLTIDPAPKRVERISICENKDTLINGKSYFDPIQYPVGEVFHDTAYKHNAGNECDSIIYYEITKIPQRHLIETRIMHEGDTVVWQGDTILEHATRIYTHETEIDPATGCEMIYQLRVIAEDRTNDAICETELPYLWQQNNKEYYNAGLYTDTTFDADGKISAFYTLNLRVDTIAKKTEYYYVCSGHPDYVYGRLYGDDPTRTDYVDTFTQPYTVPGSKCTGEVTVVVTVSSEKVHYETVVLRDGQTLDWNQYHITTGGEYRDTTQTGTTCDSISILYVIQEQPETVTICKIDTAESVHIDKRYPYFWKQNQQYYNTSGIYTDTIFDTNGHMTEFHALYLTITQPYDTTVIVRGCETTGAYWRDEIYTKDTTFVDRIEVTPYDPAQPCDSVFHVTIKIENAYDILRYDTICEHNLPYVVGQGNQLDSVYSEGWLPPFRYRTACGCDSTVQVHLTIIPDFTIDHSDSVFVCEESMPIYIGDTVHPAFDPYRQKVDEWKGKWIGVQISRDTVIYNCNKVDSLHIIMRPHQSHIPEYEYSLCKGDSVQLFWPHKDTWYKEPGDYMDTVPTISSWEDLTHHTLIHNDRAFACDSIVKWKVRYADTLHVHMYEHIRQGDIYRFNDSILTTTGVYDSIGYYQDIKDPLDPTAPGVSSIDSAHNYCKAVYTLHLTVDPVYRYGDTIEICHPAKREYTYTFDDDLEEHYAFKFQTPEKDTAIIHLIDSTAHLSYEFYDHFYDLVVYYKQQYYTIVKDTLCYGDSIQFDQHFYEGENNKTIERYLKEPGIYYDTLPALNGCDSIIELRLELRERIIIAPQSKIVTDRELPYEWKNTWKQEDGRDTTHIDSLYVSGEYTYTMPNKYGCDSTVVLNFTVHQTHVFRDTLVICAPINKTLSHVWSTGYEQKYTTPLHNDTLHYYDTLVTFYPLDSIYDLYVDFRRTYETHVYDTICAGRFSQIDTYHSETLPKRYYTETGIYYDTIQTQEGCDSVIILHLQVWPGFPTSHKRADIADVKIPYLWTHTWMENGQVRSDTDSLYIAGEYSRTLPNIHGCDSIDSLSLYIHPTYHITDDTINICANDIPFSWRGLNNITTTGDYQYGEQTVDGYDSIHYVHVNVWKQAYDTITMSICEGDSLRWGLTKSNTPRFLYNPGLYNDTFPTSHGCDSIRVLRLNVYPKHISKYDAHIADVDTPYVWKHFNAAGDSIGEHKLYAGGKYEYIFNSQYQCDSIDSLTLYIHNTYKFTEEITICERETPYEWHNRNDITESGTYIYNPRTQDGYDSIYIATITVIPTVRNIISEKICKNNLPFNFHGTDLWEGGIYIDTLQLGCDSIVELHLTVNDPYYHFERHDIYEGETYEFFGEACTTTNTYTHRAETPDGCDSITEVLLVVHPLIDTVANVCAYDLPFAWVNHWTGETTYLQAGGLYHNKTVVNDEPLFWSIQLNVIEPIHDTIRAAICEGSSYPFIGMDLTEPGIYRDTTQGSNGCDSITTLILSVNQPYYSIIRESILEGHSYEFYGETYSTSGTYTHYARTPEGCDSTTVLQLSVHPMVDTIINVCNNDLPVIWTNRWNGKQELIYTAGLYRNDTTINSEKRFFGIQVNVNNQVFDTIRHAMCEGASYEFKGNTYYEAGLYRDTLRAANGCDSIVTLILTVNQPYYNIIRESILEGHSYDFYGETYSTSGTYTHYARTPEGCDSTTVLQLSVHPMVDTIINVCNNDLPVIWTNRWNGKQELIYTAGLYRNDTTINSEKRFFGIQVNVNNQVFDTIRHAMCEGASYEFKGNTYYEAGLYRDTLRAANGCDSIVTLILTVNQPYYNIIRESILEGHSYDFYGETYSTSGTYTHYARTPEGCDSTTVLQLSVHPMVDTIINVCNNDLPVIWTNRWNGKQELIYTAGLYRNDTTINSEKRFFGIQVNVNNQVFDTIRHAMCEGASYEFKGNTYYEAGLYRDTLRAANGCDSIVTLILTVNQPYYNIIRESILEGHSYEFYDETYSTSGTYTHYARTPEGCDSTTVLELTVHQLVDTIITVCSSELPYIWHNRWSGLEEKFYTAGTYRNDTTMDRERMYYGVRLIVTEPSSTTIYREICEGDAYNFNNRFLSTAGEYRDTLKNTAGCDSIIVLHLNVLRKYYNTVERTIYEGDSVLFQGQYFKEAGTYPFYFTSSFGCDSIIELRLSVSRLFDDSVIVCTNDLPYRWTLPSDSTKQMTIYESGIYRDTLTNSEGIQTVIGLKVNVLPIAHAPEPINVTICEGAYYKFGNAMLTEQGTYYDTLTASNGCDSVVMLALQVLPLHYQSEIRRIYEGDSVLFYDTWYKESGVYEHRELNANGCTDTYQLILTVLKEFHVDTTAYVCANNLPYVWHGIEYSESGDYSMPVSWTDSSRVVMTLHLFVRDAFYGERNVTLCEGNVFIFRKDTFRTSATFYDTIPSQHGCDSIIKYTLQVHPKYERWDTAHISDKDYYDFNGRQLSIPGDYEYVGKTSNGCDSSIFLHLEVHPSYLYTEYRNVCAPDTVHWHGQIIQMDTAYQISKTTTRYGKDTVYTYRDPYLTRYGFDSVYELKLAVHPSYYIYEQYLIKDGETTTIHGIKITKTDSIYTDTLKTLYGCDSIYQIAVNTKRMIEVERDVTICDGDYYDLYGQKLSKAGKYTKMSSNGDTIAHINLTVNPVSVIKQRIVITDEEVPYIYGGHLYTPEIPIWDYATQSWDKDVKTTIENSEYLNQYGCDSTVYLELVVTTHYSNWDQIPLCSNDTVIIDNDTITRAGYYTFVRRSDVTKRMDSLYRVEVYEAPKYEMPPIKRTICEHDTVHFFDRVLTTAGDYTQKLKSIDGCDSIITMRLIVNPTIEKETYVRIYEKYLPYIWPEDNRECYKSGDYVKTWQTGECINTSTLHLTIVQPVVEERVICGDDSIKWRNDQWYGTEGYYYDTVYKTNTDTITDVFVLHLVKGLPTKINSLKVEEIQEDANEFQIAFTTDNGLYYTTKVNVLFNNGPSAAFSNIYDAQATKNGENYIVSIPIPHYSDTCYESHHKYIKPGYYSVQVQLDNGACARSESEAVEFLVKYPSWIIEQNWQDIVAPLNEKCNCGYEFSKIEWKDEKDYPYMSKATDYLHNPNLKAGDQVVMWATRKGEKVAIPTHPLTIVPYTWQKYDDPILVYPTQAPRHMPVITIEAPQGGQFAIYSSTGTLITEGQMSEGITTVTLPGINGIYIIRTLNGKDYETHKVIVY